MTPFPVLCLPLLRSFFFAVVPVGVIIVAVNTSTTAATATTATSIAGIALQSLLSKGPEALNPEPLAGPMSNSCVVLGEADT